MALNVSRFERLNVADTCAIWNVLSSPLFYATARSAGVYMCCTSFVLYECLHKPRKEPKLKTDAELQRRLRAEIAKGGFPQHHLTVEDLQEVTILESRKRLSKGELASIAFANKTNQAFITDDKGAQRLAQAVMPPGMAQTTPHLFGWLFFNHLLLDGDKDVIIEQHKACARPLASNFEEAYREALRCQLMVSTSAKHV